MKYVISYNVNNPMKSLVIGNASIRSGETKAFKTLPVNISILKNIQGVIVKEVDDSFHVHEILVPNPKLGKVEKIGDTGQIGKKSKGFKAR